MTEFGTGSSLSEKWRESGRRTDRTFLWFVVEEASSVVVIAKTQHHIDHHLFLSSSYRTVLFIPALVQQNKNQSYHTLFCCPLTLGGIPMRAFRTAARYNNFKFSNQYRRHHRTTRTTRTTTVPTAIRESLFIIPNNNTTMKLHFSILASTLTSSSAYVAPWASYAPASSISLKKKHRRHQPFLTSVQTTATSTSLSSLASPEAAEISAPVLPQALTPSGIKIADAKPVSFFRGGLVALKIDDDDMILDNTSTGGTATNNDSSSDDGNAFGGDLIGHQVSLPDGRTGVVVVHRPPIAFALFDGVDEFEAIDGTVDVLDSLATLGVSENVREIDCFGRDLTGGEPSSTSDDTSLKRAIFAPIPQVGDIALINQPVLTGVTMMDALAPIGQGQNMLLIGHDLSSMRRYAIDLLEAQKGKRKLIYAATRDDDEIKDMLEDAGLLQDVTIVTEDGRLNKDSASKAAESTTIAASACAMAEALARDQGADTIVIVDNIDQHKQLWDETTRVLVDVFGAEAVVQSDRDGGASSEMRAFYSSLVQRSAQYKKSKGGGSVTLLLMTTIPKIAGDDGDTVFSVDDFADASAKVKERIDILVKKNIPLTADTLRKIQIPVPSDSEGVRRLALQHVDDLISMSDGQIWLDERLENMGRRPPMDPQRSITRVGIGADTQSRADAPAMRKIVEGLRLEISQAASMDGADMQNNASKKQMRKANALLLVMHQEPGAQSRLLSESCALMHAASKGYLDDTVDRGVVPGSQEGDELLSGLLDYVKSNAPEAVAEVDETNDIGDESFQALDAAIKAYFDSNEPSS